MLKRMQENRKKVNTVKKELLRKKMHQIIECNLVKEIMQITTSLEEMRIEEKTQSKKRVIDGRLPDIEMDKKHDKTWETIEEKLRGLKLDEGEKEISLVETRIVGSRNKTQRGKRSRSELGGWINLPKFWPEREDLRRNGERPEYPERKEEKKVTQEKMRDKIVRKELNEAEVEEVIKVVDMKEFFSDDWGLDIENEGVERHSGENGEKLRMAHNRESGGQERIVEKTSESNNKSEPPKTGEKLVKKMVKKVEVEKNENMKQKLNLPHPRLNKVEKKREKPAKIGARSDRNVKIEKKEKVCTLKDFLEHIEKKKSSRPELLDKIPTLTKPNN